MAVPRNHNCHGFTLIELLAYLSIYTLVLALLLPGYQKLTEVQQKIEMDGFCRSMATDITNLQQASLWNNSLKNKLILNMSEQSYSVYLGGEIIKHVQLGKVGAGKLYFYSPNTQSIAFSDEGAPKMYFFVSIKNRQMPKLTKKLEVQPVTGRVVVSDS